MYVPHTRSSINWLNKFYEMAYGFVLNPSILDRVTMLRDALIQD